MGARHNFDANRIRRALEIALGEGSKLVMFELQANMRRLLDNEGKGRIYSRSKAGRRIMSQLNLRQGQFISEATRSRILYLGGSKVRAPRGGQYGGMTPAGGRVISRVSQGRAQPLPIGSWVPARGLRERKVGIHRASLPGDPPAKDTGRLINSTQTLPKRRRVGRAVGWRVTLGVPYARILEYGIGIAPRPFVRPAIKMTEPKAPQIIRSMLARFGFFLRPR